MAHIQDKNTYAAHRPRLQDLLHKGFIAPFTDVPLKGLYFASLLFAFGFTTIDLFFILDFSALGPIAVMNMLLAKYMLACLILLPGMMYLSRHLNKKLLMTLYMGTPAVSLYILSTLYGQDLLPWVVGVIYAMSCSSFWAMYHITMMAHSSDHNKGNEISIAINGLNIGCIGGFFVGGLLSQMSIEPFLVAMGGASLMLTAIILQSLYFLKTGVLEKLTALNSHDENIIQAFKKYPRRTIGTLLQGAFDVPSKAAWPLFMTLSGLSAIAAGTVQAVTTLFKLVFSPWIGHWVNSGSGKEMSYGSLLQAGGWGPWLALNTPWLVPFSSFMWAVGSHFYDIGLSKRWYSCRSVAGVMAREIMLGLGRSAAALCVIPLLLISPYLFATAAFGIALLMITLAHGYLREGIALHAAGAAE